jgi:hypothetical protein
MRFQFIPITYDSEVQRLYIQGHGSGERLGWLRGLGWLRARVIALLVPFCRFCQCVDSLPGQSGRLSCVSGK